MSVNVPQAFDSSGTRTIVPMVGAAVGSYFGGAVGGIAGKKVGEGLVAGGANAQGVDPKQSAIGRRIGAIEEDPSVQLAKAQAALQQLPPEYAQQFGSTIAQARQMDANGG